MVRLEAQSILSAKKNYGKNIYTQIKYFCGVLLKSNLRFSIYIAELTNSLEYIIQHLGYIVHNKKTRIDILVVCTKKLSDIQMWEKKSSQQCRACVCKIKKNVEVYIPPVQEYTPPQRLL